MTTILGTLLAFIALLAAWRCWKKTARAAVRDRLFELRDELRDHYVRNGLDMTDGTYGRVRDLLNNMLRYTKGMRMMGYLYFATHVDRETVEAAAAEFEASIQKHDADTIRLITRIRHRACSAVFLYMGETSLGFLSASAVVIAAILPKKILSVLKRCLKTVIEIKSDTLEYAVMV